VTAAAVVGAGWHDVCMRWDISTPQRVVGRLEALPGQGSLTQPGKKLFAERDRFGKWQHLLGPRHALISYTVDSPTHGLIRRLELQAHLGDEGVQTVKLIDRVQLGELMTAQYEQLTGFLDAERLGLKDRIYRPETARRRRALAKAFGIGVADAEVEPLAIALDDLLEVPRSAWPVASNGRVGVGAEGARPAAARFCAGRGLPVARSASCALSPLAPRWCIAQCLADLSAAHAR
jgi:hypothetical protein